MDRPIIFSAPMVRALLAGRKTQTRRLLNPQPTTFQVDGADCEVAAIHIAGDAVPRVATGRCITLQKLRYAVGDRLYVREAFAVRSIFSDVVEVGYSASKRHGHTEYVEQIPVQVASGAEVTWPKARPSIHMPRWASRLTLSVEQVRIERLSAITEVDARAEGAKQEAIGVPPGSPAQYQWDHGQDTAPDYAGFVSAGASFRHLWRSLHGEESWDANPFVVALTFSVQHGNIDRIAA